jgi:hypothetical protein
MTVFTGTAGDDSFLGGKRADDFHLEQGGDDTAIGGGGVEYFFMGASFTGDDQIDGGGQRDILKLDGDYSAGVVFNAETLKAVEVVEMAAGHSYAFSGIGDANIEGVDGDQLFFDARALGAGDQFRLDASGATHRVIGSGGAGDDKMVGGAGGDFFIGNGGHDSMVGGAGDDDFFVNSDLTSAKGGEGDDIFENQFGHQLDRSKLDGGAGFDTLAFSQPTTEHDDNIMIFGGRNLHNIEKLVFDDGFTNQILGAVMADGNVAAGDTLVIDASKTGRFYFDGSDETDGSFDVFGPGRGDSGRDCTMIGGAGDDILRGVSNSLLVGGAGDDILSGSGEMRGGLGADVISAARSWLIYHSVEESTEESTDIIKGLGRGLTLDLHDIDADTTVDGDQAFHQVAALSGQAGELAITYFERSFSLIEGDVDGDGTADLVIQVSGGDFTDFTGFVL